MNGSSRMNASPYSGRFNGSDHEYTLSEPTAVANGADWLHLRPVHPRKTLYKVPQGFSLPGKQFLTNSSQHFGDLYWIKP